MAVYIFSIKINVGAESEDEAREGLMDLMADIVHADDSQVFDLVRVEAEA